VKEQKSSALLFLAVGILVSIVVGLLVGQWLWTTESIATGIIVGLLCSGLTLFFFWVGAGGFDKYVVDGMVNGIGYFSGFFGMLFRKLQTGRVQTYIVFVLIGFMILFYIFR
jgi:NADH-quinone oxidoreductase subunit L